MAGLSPQAVNLLCLALEYHSATLVARCGRMPRASPSQGPRYPGTNLPGDCVPLLCSVVQGDKPLRVPTHVSPARPANKIISIL